MKNRFSYTIKVLFWGVVALVGVYFLVVSARGGDPLGNLGLNLNSEPDLVLYEKTITADMDDITIQWDTGGVAILPGTDDNIQIIERSSKKLDASQWAEITQSGKNLKIVGGTKGNFYFFFWHTPGSSLEVRLPEDLYDSLRLQATSGTYEVRDLDFASLSLELTSGKLNVDRSSVGDLKLSMQSGQSRLIGINAQTAAISSTSGSFQYEGSISRSLDAELTSGEQVYALEGQAPEELKLKMSSGSAAIELPANPGFRLSLGKTSGSFQADFLHTESGGTYIYGDGSNRYTANMTSGSLKISVK